MDLGENTSYVIFDIQSLDFFWFLKAKLLFFFSSGVIKLFFIIFEAIFVRLAEINFKKIS